MASVKDARRRRCSLFSLSDFFHCQIFLALYWNSQACRGLRGVAHRVRLSLQEIFPVASICGSVTFPRRRVGASLFRLSAIILAGLLSFAAQDRASSHETSNQSPVAAASFAPIALTIPDTDVIDQNGRKLKFYRDLVKGRAVAINFIFTTCRTICPMLTATFGAVQEDVGDRLGRDLFLISISLDPENDTAFELSAYAQKFGAKSGWTFVTGQPADIAILLKALNASAPVTEDHTAIALIGNGAANTWRRA